MIERKRNRPELRWSRSVIADLDRIWMLWSGLWAPSCRQEESPEDFSAEE